MRIVDNASDSPVFSPCASCTLHFCHRAFSSVFDLLLFGQATLISIFDLSNFENWLIALCTLPWHVCTAQLLLRTVSTFLPDLCVVIVIHDILCAPCTLHLSFGCSPHAVCHYAFHILILHVVHFIHDSHH